MRTKTHIHIYSNKYRVYNAFISVKSDHRIVSVNIRLRLIANNLKSSKIKLYDWARLKIYTGCTKTQL